MTRTDQSQDMTLKALPFTVCFTKSPIGEWSINISLFHYLICQLRAWDGPQPLAAWALLNNSNYCIVFFFKFGTSVILSKSKRTFYCMHTVSAVAGSNFRPQVRVFQQFKVTMSTTRAHWMQPKMYLRKRGFHRRINSKFISSSFIVFKVLSDIFYSRNLTRKSLVSLLRFFSRSTVLGDRGIETSLILSCKI